MKDTLLTSKHKSTIAKAITAGDFKKIISILDSVSTKHSGTAKMKDKRFVISEIVKYINAKSKKPINDFYKAGIKILKLNSDNAKEVGIHILYRSYKLKPDEVTKCLYKITNDDNWEVREYAAGALSGTLKSNPEFYSTLKKWTKDKSENIRRGVVLAAAALRDRNDTAKTKKAFSLFEALMYDSSRYVKVNLGPFILGSYFGNHMPEAVCAFLEKMIKINDPHVMWNIAMAFNNSFGNNHPDEAVKFLKRLKRDKDPIVQRAVKSTINHLRKRNKNISI